MAEQLQPIGRSIRPEHHDVSCVLSSRLSHHHSHAVMKWLLYFLDTFEY